MKAVILAGGRGTRLLPLTNRSPKALLPIAGRPLLAYGLALLQRHGITDIVLALHYRAETIRAALQDGAEFGVRLRYVVEETPLGSGGAIKNASALLDDRFVVYNADILTDMDLTALVQFHCNRQALTTLAVTQVTDATGYGLVEMDDAGSVTRFVEKPDWSEHPRGWVNTAVWIMERRALEFIPAGVPYSVERQLFPELLAAGERLCALPCAGYWLDVGTPEKYRQANEKARADRLAPA